MSAQRVHSENAFGPSKKQGGWRALLQCACVGRPTVEEDPLPQRGKASEMPQEAFGAHKSGKLLVPATSDSLKLSDHGIAADYSRQHVVECVLACTPTSSERASSEGGTQSLGDLTSSGDYAASQSSESFHDALSRCSLTSWGSAEGSESQDSSSLGGEEDVHDDQALAHSHLPGLLYQPKADLPPWVPDTPLLFGSGADTRFVPAPTGALPFHGYWARDFCRSPAQPWATDLLMGGGRLCHSVKASIQGIKMSDTPASFKVQMRAYVLGCAFMYTEEFRKDSSLAHWSLRRDVGVGHSKGQCFFTADGRLVIRVWSTSGGPEAYYEDHVELTNGGNTSIITQYCRCQRTGRVATQLLVGHRAELPTSGKRK